MDRIIFLDPDYGKGFYKLPKPDDGDVFFDIEGYQEWIDLLSMRSILQRKGKFKFKDLWAKKFDRESENIFIDINFFEKR